MKLVTTHCAMSIKISIEFLTTHCAMSVTISIEFVTTLCAMIRQALLAAREQDVTQTLGMETRRREEMANAAEGLLSRNASLEAQLQEEEAKAVVLRAALDEMSDYVERVAGARRAQRQGDGIKTLNSPVIVESVRGF